MQSTPFLLILVVRLLGKTPDLVESNCAYSTPAPEPLKWLQGKCDTIDSSHFKLWPQTPNGPSDGPNGPSAILVYFSKEHSLQLLFILFPLLNLQHPFPFSCPQLKTLPPTSLRKHEQLEGSVSIFSSLSVYSPASVFPRSAIPSTAASPCLHWTPSRTS